MEIGRSWWARCNVSHAFYCFSWLLFQSPVTEALAMTWKVIEQCGLTWDDHRDPSLCRSCSLTGHCIRYTLLVQDWTPFAFRTAFILRGIESTRCWKYSSEILVHLDMIVSRSCCRFVYWIEIWWLWRPFELSEVIVMLKKTVWDKLSFVAWCIILLEVAIRRWVHCSRKGMDMVSNNTQVGCGV